jgi:hypothetical protein
MTRQYTIEMDASSKKEIGFMLKWERWAMYFEGRDDAICYNTDEPGMEEHSTKA